MEVALQVVVQLESSSMYLDEEISIHFTATEK